MKKFHNITMIEGIGFDSNIYVFDDVIVDTGTGQNIEYVLNSIKEAGFNISEDIKRIVNTHCHFDHTGGNHFFNAKIAIHQADAPALENGDINTTAAYMFGKPIEPMKVDFHLKEGDKINDFEVIHTPGHTAGGICLYDGETLISGDTVFAEGGFGRFDIGGDIKMLKTSLEKLSNLDVEYLLPGHGPAVDNGSEHINLSNRNIKQF
ncbi:MAG: MBL fold metallo-hydrolase [Methanobacterium sp.]|uniref:MBL fold metallo-hydrolase n=1 Tax=Methanobacterium sp. TaxID=2164 RepID=UPI003D661200|nr:MBL fold metallo-hydrolase [Methanobacterium sp.]